MAVPRRNNQHKTRKGGIQKKTKTYEEAYEEIYGDKPRKPKWAQMEIQKWM